MTTGSTPQPTSPRDRTPDSHGQDHLIRSEEQLQVRTDRVIAGYARLEKFTVTETKTITVEVTHEEVRLVRRAADASPADHQGLADPASDSARWMVLSREEVVISKRVVPVERVRLEMYPVVEQRQVTEQLRKEHIDTAPHIDGPASQDSGPLS